MNMCVSPYRITRSLTESDRAGNVSAGRSRLREALLANWQGHLDKLGVAESHSYVEVILRKAAATHEFVVRQLCGGSRGLSKKIIGFRKPNSPAKSADN
jgi:hypothetical protein